VTRTLNRRAIEILADAKIREAQEQGLFDGLPGAGKPIPDIDEPYDELWWVKRWVRREQIDLAVRQGRKDERVRKLEALGYLEDRSIHQASTQPSPTRPGQRSPNSRPRKK
jgi:hypothetical protein